MSGNTLPWRPEPHFPERVEGFLNGMGVTVADCGCDNDLSQAQRTAIAAFIVKACNSHEALVEALQTALVVVALEAAARGELDVDYDQSAVAALRVIEAALAKAEAVEAVR